MPTRRAPARGFTVVELLVVFGVIIVLLALLLPALATVRRSGQQTISVSHMKQIGQWMTLYSTENREYILPSHFDYSSSQFTYKGTVRAGFTPQQGAEHEGTWADILWTQFKLGSYPPARTDLGHDYSRDAPDHALYQIVDDLDNPLRSAAPNSRNTPGTSPNDEARPFGRGASEIAEPGYFAANSFFDAFPTAGTGGPGSVGGAGRWFQTGEIVQPDRSMYLVDSIAGETIGQREDASGLNHQAFRGDFNTDDLQTLTVDFRYAGECLMLFLDGHVDDLTPWGELRQLEGEVLDGETDPTGDARDIRVRFLDQRPAPRHASG